MSATAGKGMTCGHNNWQSLCHVCKVTLTEPENCKQHVGTTYLMENGKKGTRCCYCLAWLADVDSIGFATRKQKAPPTSKYQKRTSKHVGPKGQPQWVEANWDGVPNIDNFYDCEKAIREWNANAEANELDVRYQLPLHCSQCFHECHETFVGNTCQYCRSKEMICTRCSKYTSKPKQLNAGGALCEECYNNSIKANGIDKPLFHDKTKAFNTPAPVTITRKNGDYWKLPSANAPVNAEQWGYQGSGKKPYVITHYKVKRDGSTTIDGWACSCASFIRNTPRDHCKHIVKIMASEGIMPATMKNGSTKTLKALAGVSDEKLAAFETWQKEQAEAAAKPLSTNDDAPIAAKGIMSTGRKFR